MFGKDPYMKLEERTPEEWRRCAISWERKCDEKQKEINKLELQIKENSMSEIEIGEFMDEDDNEVVLDE